MHRGAFVLLATAALAASLRIAPHPRLIATQADIGALSRTIASDPNAGTLFQRLVNHSQPMLHAPQPGSEGVLYTLGLLWRITRNRTYADAGIRSLMAAAANKDFCSGCGGDCSQLEANGGQNAAPRSASLCFGRLGHAVSVGYDWLFDAMTEPQRASAVRMISTQLLSVYSQGLSRAYTASYWYWSRDNFNSVINSGALMAALAVLGPEDTAYAGNSTGWGNTTQFALDTLQVALLALPNGAGSIFADGSYPEGPGYGEFALTHHLVAVLGLRTALNRSFGLDVAGLGAGARYYLDITGPSGNTFNWADGGTGLHSWLPNSMAVKFTSPGDTEGRALRYWGRQVSLDASASMCTGEASGKGADAVNCPMWLLHYSGIGEAADLDALGGSRLYDGVDLAVLRAGGWAGTCAACGTGQRPVTWLGVKGGSNALQQLAKSTTHTHADQGSFVLDMLGERWALELGADSYMAYGYFSLQKYEWYDAATQGHNTLLMGGNGQDACTAENTAQLPAGLVTNSCAPIDPHKTECRARVSQFNATDSWAVVELGGAYATSGVQRVTRGVALLPGDAGAPSGVLVRDEITVGPGGDRISLSWGMHTAAQVSVLAATKVRLSLNSSCAAPVCASSVIELEARSTLCAGLQFGVIESSEWQPTQVHHQGLRKLILSSPRLCPVVEVSIRPVQFNGTQLPLPASAPLGNPIAEWGSAGPAASI